MASVYEQYMNDIVRSEYKHYFPTSVQNFNAPNKKIEFNIDYGDSFSMSNYQYLISGTYTKKDGTLYADKSNIKLIDNFVPYLFTRIEVKKHNYLIDEVDYPGVTSTVKGLITYSSTDSNSLKNTGFISVYEGSSNKFQVCGNLSQLGLGFFEDVKIPIYKGGFTVSFIRSDGSDGLYRWKTKKADGADDPNTLPAEGKVEITDFIIRAPLIEFKPASKIMLLKQLTDLTSVRFHFRRWQCIKRTGVLGNTLSFDISNIYRNITTPTFVLVTFQTENQLNLSEFPNLDVKNIRIKINDVLYPEELQNLEFDQKCYAVAYDMYKDFKRVYNSEEDMFLDPQTFIAKKCVFVIDTSKQNENISNSRSNIILNVDFLKPAPNGTVAYIVIVSHTNLNYDIINNVIKEE